MSNYTTLYSDRFRDDLSGLYVPYNCLGYLARFLPAQIWFLLVRNSLVRQEKS
jgi:hypothetical protein